jgi:DNA gyrase inhibitor GyrI
VFGLTPTHARARRVPARDLESVVLDDPEVVTLAGVAFAGVTEHGRYYESAPQAWARVRAALRELAAGDDAPLLYVGVAHADPHDADAQREVRYTAGVYGVGHPLPGFTAATLPGGKYARFSYRGRMARIGLAYHHIFGAWAEETSERIDRAVPQFVLSDRLPDPRAEEDLRIFVKLEEDKR